MVLLTSRLLTHFLLTQNLLIQRVTEERSGSRFHRKRFKHHWPYFSSKSSHDQQQPVPQQAATADSPLETESDVTPQAKENKRWVV